MLMAPLPMHRSGINSTSKHATNSGVNHRNNNNGSGNVCTNFSKGSLIELSSGELKRVEDMRAEDFITSSKKNPDLQLVDTTVVKISSNSHCVTITFAYNNSKVSGSANLNGKPFPYLQSIKAFSAGRWK